MVKLIEIAPAKQCRCGTCRATLEYDFADIQSKSYECARDGGGTSYWIICPQCKSSVFVSKWN